MATYFMFGKYSLEGMKGISAGRTAKTLCLDQKTRRRVQGRLCAARRCGPGPDRRDARSWASDEDLSGFGETTGRLI